MALERYEFEQRMLGNIAAAEEAKKIREDHGDLPAVEVTPSGVVMPTELMRMKIESFRPRSRIYSLDGNQYNRRVFGGSRYVDLSLRRLPGWEGLLQERSRKTWAAFTPDPLSYIDVNQDPDKVQQDIDVTLEAYNQELQEKTGIDEIEAVQGSLSDYIDLGSQYLRRYGSYFGNPDERPVEHILTATRLGSETVTVRFDLESLASTVGSIQSLEAQLAQITDGSRDFPNGFPTSVFVLHPIIVPIES